MHQQILSEEQAKLLPFVKKFIKEFGLVGGTAIALQLGHRRSIDFDMFTFLPFKNDKIRRMVKKDGLRIGKVYMDESGQFTFFINGVQFTFYEYPYEINYTENFQKILRMPDLLSLGAMKAFALGQRAKWKDYVDLYFILQQYSLIEIIGRSKEIFGEEFNERMIRQQLSYFDDINYSEKVDFLPGFEVSERKIKKALIDYSLS